MGATNSSDQVLRREGNKDGAFRNSKEIFYGQLTNRGSAVFRRHGDEYTKKLPRLLGGKKDELRFIMSARFSLPSGSFAIDERLGPGIGWNKPVHVEPSLIKQFQVKKEHLAIIFGLLLLTPSVHGQDERYMLHYDSPASSDASVEIWGAGSNPPRNPGLARAPARGDFLKEALLLGNGRLGAMFSGGIGQEHLMLNEITAWSNTVRGRDKVSQSGARIGAYKDLEKVREAARNGRFGSDENSLEVLAAKYLASHTRLGNYAPFTDVYITTGHDTSKATHYQRTLNLRTGIGTVSYKIGNTKYTREIFCSYPNDLLVMRYSSDGEPFSLRIETATQLITKYKHGYVNRIWLIGETPMIRDNMEFAQIIHVLVKENQFGIGADPEGVIHVRDANEVTIYIAGYTDYLPDYPAFKGRDYELECQRAVSEAVKAGYDAMKKAHVKDLTGLIDRCKLELEFTPSGLTTDKIAARGQSVELENLFFNFGRYLQTACSRGTSTPSNIQGLWNNSLAPPWNADYHLGPNTNINYLMVETANLPECFRPYVEWMKIIAEAGRYVAKENFGTSKGWSCGLNSNIFGFTAQNELGRRMMQSGAWLCLDLYKHYLFEQDREFLEEIYPIIKGAADFYVEYLEPWKDGTLTVYPTWSPENSFLPDKYGRQNKVAYGTAADVQLVYNLFTDCIEASTILGRDGAFRKTLQAIIPKLTPQKVGRWGQLQEWHEDWDDPDDTHGLTSHLVGLYPGRDVSPLINRELAEAARVTLDHRGGGRNRKRSTGFDGAWRAGYWARLLDSEEAYLHYSRVATGYTRPNLFQRRMQVDANLGAPAALCEMLLQSHLRSIDNDATTIDKAAFCAYVRDEESPRDFTYVVPDETLTRAPYIIHLLPALPKAWPKGKVTGLRARGGFEVDIEWEDGSLEQATIRAVKGGEFRVYSNGSLSRVMSLEEGESMVWRE